MKSYTGPLNGTCTTWHQNEMTKCCTSKVNKSRVRIRKNDAEPPKKAVTAKIIQQQCCGSGSAGSVSLSRIRIRIVFAWIRIKVRPGSGYETNFFISWIHINMIRIGNTAEQEENNSLFHPGSRTPFLGSYFIYNICQDIVNKVWTQERSRKKIKLTSWEPPAYSPSWMQPRISSPGQGRAPQTSPGKTQTIILFALIYSKCGQLSSVADPDPVPNPVSEPDLTIKSHKQERNLTRYR